MKSFRLLSAPLAKLVRSYEQAASNAAGTEDTTEDSIKFALELATAREALCKNLLGMERRIRKEKSAKMVVKLDIKNGDLHGY